MNLDADRDSTAGVARLGARGDRVRVVPAGLAERRSELVAQALARHGKQVATGLARGHPQIAVGRSREIEALVLSVDQDRSGRIALEQQTLREVARAKALRRGRARLSRP